jgi:hypothetical protein
VGVGVVVVVELLAPRWVVDVVAVAVAVVELVLMVVH